VDGRFLSVSDAALADKEESAQDDDRAEGWNIQERYVDGSIGRIIVGANQDDGAVDATINKESPAGAEGGVVKEILDDEVVDVKKESQIATFLRGRASLPSLIKVKEVVSESDDSRKRQLSSLTGKSDGIVTKTKRIY